MSGTGEGHTDSTTQDPRTTRLLVSVPVLLRALASYLEVTGESEKFTRHLSAVIRESGRDVEILVGGDPPEQVAAGGERPDQIAPRGERPDQIFEGGERPDQI